MEKQLGELGNKVYFERLESESVIRDLILWHNVNSNFVVLDIETTSIEARKAEILDIQLSGMEDDHVVIFKANYGKLLEELSREIVVVAHNAKYDLHVLFRHGVNLLSHKYRDTILIGHLVDENRQSYSLDSYVKEYFNDDYKETFWNKYQSYEEASEEDRVSYACQDIIFTSRLYRILCDLLYKESIPDSLVTHVHRLQASLLYTEIQGIRIDIDYLGELGVRLKKQIDELGPRMRSLVTDEIDLVELEAWQKKIDSKKSDKGKSAVLRPSFSFESTQQLQKLLYGVLKLPLQRNEKTKAVSTDSSSLEKIKNDHLIIPLIQENRELQKVYTSYVEGTIERLEQERIYPQFRVNGTVTGRLSHSNPNLAQLPKSGGVRGIYVPDRGRVLISADYSQLEVVLEANLTSDKNLVRMLENGESKHDLTARELGCDRHTAKTLNFALQYWASHFKVAKLLGVSTNEGLRVYNRYWEIYKGSKELKSTTDKMVDDGMPIVTQFGRKRRFEVRNRHPWDGDYRQAFNFLIQSTGADITSRAFYLVSEDLELNRAGHGITTIHDELLIDVRKEWADYWDKRIVELMVGVGTELDLKLPLQAVSSGPMPRWLD